MFVFCFSLCIQSVHALSSQIVMPFFFCIVQRVEDAQVSLCSVGFDYFSYIVPLPQMFKMLHVFTLFES